MTNGDKIRKMTDEELIAVLQCPYEFTEIFCKHTDDDIHCGECIKEWLENKAEEGENE